MTVTYTRMNYTPATQNPLTNTNYITNSSKNAYPASEIPISTTLVKGNLFQFKHSLLTQNEKFSIGWETQFLQPNFPLIIKNSMRISKSDLQRTKSVPLSHLTLKISRLIIFQKIISIWSQNLITLNLIQLTKLICPLRSQSLESNLVGHLAQRIHPYPTAPKCSSGILWH